MKKFTQNDLFYNTLQANPKFTIIMYSGSLRINGQNDQNYEKSSSISGLDYTSQYTYGTYYSGTYNYTASISRDFIYATSSAFGDGFHSGYTYYNSLKKISSLKNLFSHYVIENEFSNIKYYLKDNGIPYYNDIAWNPGDVYTAHVSPRYFIIPTSSMSFIDIPRDFYGNYIKPGSVTLNMYVSGVLTASARDLDYTGKLIQVTGSVTGNVIGSVFYDHGFIILTGSDALSSETDHYIQPLVEQTGSYSARDDYLKWIYFGSYSATSGSGINTKYELIFQGTNYIPTITMFCHADKNEFFWSNNRTFIENGNGDNLFLGQSASSILTSSGVSYLAPSNSIFVPSSPVLKENTEINIKNTISSSFSHYSSSYEPQTFISQIGIYDEEKNLIAVAKLANPVRKTKELEYTFKLKLDL